MGNKVVKARAGDKWTKYLRPGTNGTNYIVLWVYRGEYCWAISKHANDLNDCGCPAEYRYHTEIDISTSEAHAQLRKWGYTVVDCEPKNVPTEKPAQKPDEQYVTVSQVRGIVKEMLEADSIRPVRLSRDQAWCSPSPKPASPDPDWQTLYKDAVNALRLHCVYQELPADRGGNDGPKGKAWAAFESARNTVLEKANEVLVNGKANG